MIDDGLRHGEPVHTCNLADTAIIYRLKDEFGPLSNFARNYPLAVNDVTAHSSEALYQACRFPHRPDLQQMLLAERTPREAKQASRPFLELTRADWETVRKLIMRWCLEVKLAQHRARMGGLLLASGARPIVEQSFADDYWGVTPQDDQTLRGANLLGLLWMELRAELVAGAWVPGRLVMPPAIPDFLLAGQPVNAIAVADE